MRAFRLSRPLLAQRHMSLPIRNLSTARTLLNKKPEETQKPQSILTDDLLARAGVESEATAAGEETSEGKTEGKRERRKRQTTTDVKRERYANWFYIFSFAGLAGGAGYLSRDWEGDEPKEVTEGIENGYTPDLMYKRAVARVNSIFTFFQEPPFPDLLPDSPPPPYQRPLTLVLSLEDLLVHSEWTQQHGWRTAKRPGVDYFLGYLSQYYEIVLFASNYLMYSEKIAEKLDPIHAFVTYNLFKEHCLYKDGVHIKDLSKLNRDLSKTIIVDTNPDSYKLQPENAIPMKPWEGVPDDGLLKLIPFLEYMATQQVADVRPILASFNDKNNLPQEFEERVNKLREKFESDNKKKQNNWALKSLGLAGGPTSHGPKFPLDLIREEGEKNYVRFMQLIEEEKAKIKLQQEMMAGQTVTLKDYVEGNIPSPEEQMQMQLQKQKEADALYEQQKNAKA